MVQLYECSVCRAPFVAQNEALIMQRGGACAECAKLRWLEKFGLPADFLTRRLGPGG
jgi:DNA-directed RNA polymerase subunit RPC12/RpoP